MVQDKKLLNTNRKKRRAVGAIIGVLAAFLILLTAWLYRTKVKILTLSSPVSGQIDSVLVKDQQYVDSGQLVLLISEYIQNEEVVKQKEEIVRKKNELGQKLDDLNKLLSIQDPVNYHTKLLPQLKTDYYQEQLLKYQNQIKTYEVRLNAISRKYRELLAQRRVSPTEQEIYEAEKTEVERKIKSVRENYLKSWKRELTSWKAELNLLPDTAVLQPLSKLTHQIFAPGRGKIHLKKSASGMIIEREEVLGEIECKRKRPGLFVSGNFRIR